MTRVVALTAIKAAYDTARDAYDADVASHGTHSMFVDCRLAGCVVVNPIR